MELNNKKVQRDPELFTEEDVELFNKIRKIKISNAVLNFYKAKVKGNRNETKKTATKKLIRNIMLANRGEIDMNKLHTHIFYYGNLSILINFRTKKIVWLNNNNKNRDCGKFLRLDKKKKKYLDKTLNIQKGGKRTGSCIDKKDNKRIKVEAQHLTKKEQLVLKIREDLIEVYDDMDILEKHEIRKDYLDIRRYRCDKYKDNLWKAIVRKDYPKQVDILSEMFIQYLDKKEFEEWICNINTKEKFDRFFEIFKSSDINYVKSVHATVLETVFPKEQEEVC